MVNINLSAGFEKEKEIEKKKSVQKELLIPLAVLCFLFLGYYGLVFYTEKMRNAGQAAAQEYVGKTYELLQSEKTKKVFDFQNKLSVAEKLLDKKDRTLDFLSDLEGRIIPGTFVSSYDYDSEKRILKLELISDQYNNVAKQILLLKQSEYFSDISLSKSSLDSRGKIRVPVELTVK